MNYRHAYHAGNSADVLKHSVLAGILERLIEKPAPIFVLDTHAGTGLYDIAGAEADKTEEWRSGIGRLLAAPADEFRRYTDVVRIYNPNGGFTAYPGSPAIAAELLRPGDRLVLSELHPEDAQALRRWAGTRTGVAVHHRDGYETLGAFLPPREGRGLIVLDPPYESPDEFERVAQAAILGHHRWPGGRWLIWHPIKDRAPVWKLEETLIAAGIPKILTAELLTQPADGVHLAGSGVILINPPFEAGAWLERLLPALQGALAPRSGSHAVRWLTTMN